MRKREVNGRKESGVEREFLCQGIAGETDSGSAGDARGGGVNVHAEEDSRSVCKRMAAGAESRTYETNPLPASSYLIARDEAAEEQRRRLLCDMLGPVFFGERAAGNYEELDALFAKRYGIDVRSDFCEGDEHYEEYQEAHQAIAEGLAIYGGAISFGDGALARLAEQLWQSVEEQEKGHFKRINTMLEE